MGSGLLTCKRKLVREQAGRLPSLRCHANATMRHNLDKTRRLDHTRRCAKPTQWFQSFRSPKFLQIWQSLVWFAPRGKSLTGEQEHPSLRTHIHSKGRLTS